MEGDAEYEAGIHCQALTEPKTINLVISLGLEYVVNLRQWLMSREYSQTGE